ncbi:MAG: hypothetical protein FWH21_01840 [Kiritimatiellaeota bacterium]|nr:hypothetical protein [Kiritimatiellota bacterium]
MRRFDLTGEWAVRKGGTKRIYKAVVPGCIHADLLTIREIPEPLIGKNLQEIAWVAETEWTYENQFNADDLSAFSSVLLYFEGLDGAATILLNDEELGKTTAGSRILEFDVKKRLRIGKNKLTVAFAAPVKKTRGGNPPLVGRPSMPTVGISGDVSLHAYNSVRVRDVLIRQDFSDASAVGFDVTVLTERFDPDRHMELLARICYKGNTLYEARDILTADCQTLRLTLKNAQYWWPAGMGEQPLYEILVDVFSERTCLEHLSRRIGICQVEVEKAKDGVSRLIVNRHPTYIKAALWIPPDLYPVRLSRVEYARLVKASVVANMNMLRVKDIRAYECNAFYDLCDEYGVLVWHDLLEDEMSPNIRRLRHHPCMAVWGCDDAALIKRLNTEDPGRACLPTSLYLRKDASKLPPALPEPRIAASYLGEDAQNISHPICTYHTSDASDLPRMTANFIEHFLFPSNFTNHIWLSQIQQAVLLKREWERIRRTEPNTYGFIHWHLNDWWPQASTSTVDYEGRWKAAHYLLRKSLIPIWTCGGYQPQTKSVELFAFNDTPKAFKGELAWRLTRTEGDLVLDGSKAVEIAPASRELVTHLKIDAPLSEFRANDLFLWLYLTDEHGAFASSNIVYFCEPREWNLPHPKMRAEIRAWDDNSYAVTLTSQQVAMWVWLSLEGMDARYDDNFFCIEPSRPMRIRITPTRRLKPEQFHQMLRIGSLRDTWQEKRTLSQMVASAKKARATGSETGK